ASAQSTPSTQAAQSAIPANAARQETEGDRALNAGIQAYQKKQIAEAARFWEQARTIYSRDLGPDHPSTLGAMNNLAVGQNALGQNEKARELHEQILALRRAKLGEDHRDTLASMANLANTYSELGKADKALTLHKQTLELRSAKLGEEHPDTLDSMKYLAGAYRDSGQIDKALELKNRSENYKGGKVAGDTFSARLGRWAIWPSPLPLPPPVNKTGR
ncbi:MAG: tetratricopeptide repeat protein, partial [Hyphomicrobium sp.]|nr:tetratricopeptide repeat protein [Hyphomicrobium sp.]